EEAGVDALHISAGNYTSYSDGYMIQPMAIPDGPLVPLAEKVKSAVGIPVIAVGKLRDPDLCEQVIRSGKADFVALGRVLLADHEWPKKAMEGRTSEIDKCIACNQGCISRLFEQKDVWCTVNPLTARELLFACPPGERLAIYVAGGGPAGMSAAKFAAERGHRVTLCEKEDKLGGQLFAAAAAPHRPGWAELREYLVREMDRLGVYVHLNSEAAARGAHAAIVAIGSTAVKPNIPGVEQEGVITARELLEGHVEARGAVVVAGGGCAGAQTAEYLAVRGHDVTIVEMLGDIAVDAPGAERELLLGRLHDLGVKIITNTKILSIEQGRVGVDGPDGMGYIPAETVVLCLGSRPNDDLADRLAETIDTVVVVGDALEPRKVTEAVAEGAVAVLFAESGESAARAAA
ncbi:MAG: FAD-dependent oxidoreductase, partial [Armatimonadota bacterium]